jgi:tetratricopeptide (TPR) repeat protein
MNLKAILTATGLGTALAFTAFPTSAPDVRTLGTTIASAEEHHEENENDPAVEAKELSAKINREKAEGTDVSAAVAHQQKGEAAMKAGNIKEALEHFEQAEHALGESEEHEKDKD